MSQTIIKRQVSRNCDIPPNGFSEEVLAKLREVGREIVERADELDEMHLYEICATLELVKVGN